VNLTRYQSKRNFSQTIEPRGRQVRQRDASGSRTMFVIQKHAASRLHYDFRLEMDGVLKSWAVPKGLPLIQGDKRLAVQVEEHPVEYGNFEGTIPAGNYGAGSVMLWDAGICEVIEGTPREALRRGKLVLQLQGQKLKGQWTLVQMHPKGDRNDNAWLAIKTESNARPIPARSEDRSVISGRTMKQIADTGTSPWPADQKQRTRGAIKRRAQHPR
jgi:bifunctional non-homologous end joining protein LigD